jgi:hypothetical protein
MLLAGLVAPRAARACASCSCGDTTLTASGVERPYRNRVRLFAEERYGSLAQGGDAGQETWFLRSALGASWVPWRRLALTATLPWYTTFLRRAGRPTDELNGLGDLELAVRAVLFQERSFLPRHLLFGTAGIKFPTGWRLYDATGHPYPDDDQPSSGSFDPLFGLTYAWFGGGDVSLFVSTAYRQTTRGPHGYRRGSTFGLSAAAQLQPWDRVALSAGVDLSVMESDTLANGAAAPNTGGAALYLAPAVLVSPLPDLLVRVTLDFPVATALLGQQRTGPQVALTVAYDVH